MLRVKYSIRDYMKTSFSFNENTVKVLKSIDFKYKVFAYKL